MCGILFYLLQCKSMDFNALHALAARCRVIIEDDSKIVSSEEKGEEKEEEKKTMDAVNDTPIGSGMSIEDVIRIVGARGPNS